MKKGNIHEIIKHRRGKVDNVARRIKKRNKENCNNKKYRKIQTYLRIGEWDPELDKVNLYP